LAVDIRCARPSRMVGMLAWQASGSKAPQG
jgi:hypothetical protein